MEIVDNNADEFLKQIDKEEEEILFLYVGLRNEHTYEEAEKIFRKHGVI